MKLLYLLLFSTPLWAQPLQMRGGLQIRGIYYNSEGQPPRRDPFTYVISGNHQLSFLGMHLPFSYSFSDQGRNFQQPFNRFGLSPTYKWITLHGGYRNLSFSPYTLDGHTLFGGGIELRPGKFNVGFAMGRLNKATAIDSTSGQTWAQAFHRTAFAAKAGFDGEKTSITLSYLQAKDDAGIVADSATNRPAANSVLGLAFKWKFLPKFHLIADGGFSLYTRDRFSTLNFTPDKGKKLYEALNLNASTEGQMAYTAGLGYQGKDFGIDILYRYVDPNFESMGVYYFLNDLKSLSLAPKAQLLKGKLRFQANIGIQEDNVLQQKEATTRRIIALANASYDITDKFSIDWNYSNYSSNAEPRVTFVQDKYLLAQTNTNYSITPRLLLPGNKVNQLILLSFHGAGLKDVNAEDSDIQTQVAFLSYNLIFSKFSVIAGLNYNNNTFATGKVNLYGWQAGGNANLLKKALSLGLNTSWNKSESPQGKGTILNSQLNANYRFYKKHQLQFRVNSLLNKVGETHNELTGELAYGLNF